MGTKHPIPICKTSERVRVIVFGTGKLALDCMVRKVCSLGHCTTLWVYVQSFYLKLASEQSGYTKASVLENW